MKMKDFEAMEKQCNDFGWQHWDTGGNCTALGKDLPNNMYALITDDAEKPTHLNQVVTLGIYGETFDAYCGEYSVINAMQVLTFITDMANLYATTDFSLEALNHAQAANPIFKPFSQEIHLAIHEIVEVLLAEETK